MLIDYSPQRAGRKEILTFFYLFLTLTFFSLLIDAGVVPVGSDPYPYFVAVQNGFSSALVTCLLINGFVGFQLYEDGTPTSLWMLRLSSFAAWLISFFVSLATFKSWAGLGPTNTIGLFTVLYLLNAIQLVIYVVLQVLLVVGTLEDRWPLGDIAFGVFFFIAGQVLLYAVSTTICDGTAHYIDGLFLATIGNLLAVMMVYKVCFFPVPYHIYIYIRKCSELTLLLPKVLGFYNQRRPRVFRRHEDEQLGGQGTPSRGRPTRHDIRR